MSQDSIPPYSPFSPPDFNSNASRSPWSAASQAGSGYESLNLPPINPEDNYDPFEESQYFDSLPRLPSPTPFSSQPSASRVRPQQPPPSNQQVRSIQRPPSHYGLGRYSESPDPFEEFIELTPPRTFNSQLSRSYNTTSHNTTRESSIVDLTESSPVLTMAPSRKRKADTSGEGQSTKTPRRSGTTPRRNATPRSSRATPAGKQEFDEAEIVDLVDLDADTKYEDFRKAQQEQLIKQQQQDEANKPVKLAEFQCIVCMDNPTDLTVTHCGHLFCSECLHQAMYAGNAKKTCPVCRSPINVSGTNGKKQPRNGIFALEMKLMTSKKKGKQPVRVR